MKVGADPKKIAILSGLGVLLLYFLYTNVLSSPANPEAKSSPTRTTPAPPPAIGAVGKPAPDISRPAPLKKLAKMQSDSKEWRPSLKRKPEEGAIDPMQADPTLHLELIAKVQSVKLEGGERNLFQFGTPPPPPPPKTPDIKIVPKDPLKPGAAAGDPAKPPEAPPKPPPTPIPLKFYGFTSRASQVNKRAFFLNGEEIIVATEGDLINKRYKVVRIGLDSAVVEDTQDQHQQTLPLEEQAG